VDRARVGEVLRLERIPVEPDPTVEYISIGIRSFGKGIFHYEPKMGAQLGSLRFFELKPDRLVVSNIKGWEGAIAVSSATDAGHLASNRFLSYAPIEDQIDIRWARWFFLSEPGIGLIQRASPGSADRNRTLAIDRFEALKIPLPPISEQRRVAETLTSSAETILTVVGVLSGAERLRRSLLPSARRDLLDNPDYSCRTLEEVAHLEMGQSPPGGAYNDLNEGMPLLNGPTEFGKEHPSPRQWTSAVTKVAEPGDLLICVRGATTGRINWANQRYCIGRGLAAIRPDPKHLDSSFLRHVLLHLAPEIMSRTAGSTFANLPGKRLALLPLPMPELAVQREIASALSGIEKRRDRINELALQSRMIVGALQSSLLNEAFGCFS